MQKNEAAQLATRISECINAGKPSQAMALAEPLLADGVLTHARLDALGSHLAQSRPDQLRDFLDRVALGNTPAGWRVIAAALAAQLDRTLYWALGETRHYIRQADDTAGADVMAVRVLAPALLRYPAASVAVLQEWRHAQSPFVRRALGSAVRVWARHPQAAAPQAETLIALLGGLAAEEDAQAAQGVLAGMRALARRWPRQVARWVKKNVRRGEQATRLEKQLATLGVNRQAES